MDDKPHLRKVGVVSGDKAPRGRVVAYQQKLSRAARLSDLVDEFAFYTPALYYLVVGHEVDPMQHFCLEFNLDLSPLSVAFDKPIFGNLYVGQDKQWNHVLYGLPREHWDLFCQFMGTIACTNRRTGELYRCRTQQLWICDPIVLLNSAVLPTRCPEVDITAFVIDSNRGSWYFRQPYPCPSPLLRLPEVVYDPRVHKDTAAFAQAIHRGADQPYQAVDRVLNGNQPWMPPSSSSTGPEPK